MEIEDNTTLKDIKDLDDLINQRLIEIYEIKDHITQMKSQAEGMACELSNSLTKRECLEAATWLYWNLDNIPCQKYLKELTGYGSSKLISPIISLTLCKKCNNPLIVKSKTQAREYKGDFVCDECKNKERIENDREYRKREAQREARLSTLANMPYAEYLQTQEWEYIRQAKLKSAGYKCQLCNGNGVMNVHHRTYENRGNENLKDLIVLCENCHAKHHDKVGNK